MPGKFPNAVDSDEGEEWECEEFPFPDLTTMSEQQKKQLMIAYMFFDSIEQQQLLLLEELDLLVTTLCANECAHGRVNTLST